MIAHGKCVGERFARVVKLKLNGDQCEWVELGEEAKKGDKARGVGLHELKSSAKPDLSIRSFKLPIRARLIEIRKEQRQKGN